MTSSSHRDGRSRVVVTGLGTISPIGLDVPATWEGLVRGRRGVGPITTFDVSGLPCRIAAFVRNFDPERYMDRREARRTSAFVHYAVAAAAEALGQARLCLEEEDAARVGVCIGSALGGTSIVEEQRLVLEDRGVRHVNPALIPAILINTAACMVALQMGIRGPVHAAVAACATGVVSLGDAVHLLALGEADVVLAGGTDSVTTPLAIAGFSRLGALSTRNDDPGWACAPFDGQRDGTVVGEGAAVMVLETYDHAMRRGAPVLAEVLGYGLTNDAFHLVAPEPGGEGAARAITKALGNAGVSPDELDWICAHGTATRLNDEAETRAIKLALGEHAYRVPVSSIKGAVGHMLGAAGALSVVAAVQALGSGSIPPTLNYRTPDPVCDLDYVPNESRRAAVDTVLVNAFGFGGQNACLVLRKWRE